MIRPAAIAVLACTLVLGAFAGAAFAQTKLEGAKVISPSPLPTINVTSGTTIDFLAIGKSWQTGLSTGGTITLDGTNINIGHYTTMRPNGSLNVGVGMGSLPPGQYTVKVTLVNVGKGGTLTLADGITKKACPLAAQGGYLNEQSCAIVVQSNGRSFNIGVTYVGADQFSEITLKKVDVMRDR